MAMNLRPRGGGASRRTRLGNRPVYEDFKPTTEWKHEEAADIVLFHLPGFSKEQIRIIAESKGVLRVQGERLVTSNRWSRFQEKVVVPEDCNMTEVRAKFEAGILRIIMPKKPVTVIDRRRPVEEPPKPTTTLKEPPPRPNVTKRAEDVQPKPPPPRQSQEGSSVTKAADVQPKPPPQWRQPQEGSSPTKPVDVQPKPPQHGLQQELPPKPALPTIAQTPPQFGTSMDLPQPPKTQQEATTSRAPMKPSFDFKPPQNTHDNIQQQHIPDYVKPRVVEDRKVHEDSSRVVDSKEMQLKHEKYVDAIDQEKESKSGVNRINRFDNHINVMIDRLSKRLDEDGHLLVNMGAAMLVIVALGTYISYSFGL